MAMAILDGLEASRASEKITVSASVSEIAFSALPFVVEIPGAPEDWIARLKQGCGEDSILVNGLAQGDYRLICDGVDAGVFSYERLTAGVPVEMIPHFPTVVRSRHLLDLIRRKAVEAAKLLIIAWSEHFAFPEGRPSESKITIADVEERLRKLRDSLTGPTPIAINKRLEFYAQWKKQEHEIRQEIETLEREAVAIKIDSRVHLEVRPVSVAR
jgi:hypothetical protein